ncbi:Zinc finger, C3HC-like [Dillenia turbinata]|uniref:Zinc finger, C3HC-like n=1 Tax=Dillenia turbinata TaxID=194707 RepID=A0AAN8ZBK9_9MAGN
MMMATAEWPYIEDSPHSLLQLSMVGHVRCVIVLCGRHLLKNMEEAGINPSRVGVCQVCKSYLEDFVVAKFKALVDGASEAFSAQLDAGHKVTCPWRGNSCPESLVQFPPAPQSALIGGYKDRCDGLLQFPSLPIVAASAIEHMHISRGSQLERFLSQSQNHMAGELYFKPDGIPEFETSQDGSFDLYTRALKLISLCGWEPRWLPNVQDCEEHSAQSARNGGSFGPTQAQICQSQDLGRCKIVLSASAKKDTGKKKMLAGESKCESRSPLLDCSLCGATVRIWDFLTVQRPARFPPNNIDIPDTSKKMTLTRGVSAASGINGWVPADDLDKERTEDRDEVATTDQKTLLPDTDVDLNLTMAGGLSFTPLDRTAVSQDIHDAAMGKDLIIGQPSGSEVGDRAASFESRGPSSRKRSMQQADSIEGTVIDRDGDEVTDGQQYSAGPSKRGRDSDMFDNFCSSHHRGTSGAGPSNSLGIENYNDLTRVAPFQQGSNQVVEYPSAIDSTRASSVIAMDTLCHHANEDSMESVENYPGDVDDVHFPSSSIYGNLDMNETSELNNSNQAQQSIGFQPAVEIDPGEMGVSSTNDGDVILNAETVTAQARDGFSFGVSGGSVGMCASHEAEILGADVSVYHADSVVGDMEPRAEEAENLGQTGESAPDPGLMDEIVPEETNREHPHGDSQEILSQSVARADSGSKIDGFAKAESVESGEKQSQSHKLAHQTSARLSHSYNAMVNSGYKTPKKGVKKGGKTSVTSDCAYMGSDCATANGIGITSFVLQKFQKRSPKPFSDLDKNEISEILHRRRKPLLEVYSFQLVAAAVVPITADTISPRPPKGESNYEEATEFDPIIHHNQFCPWVNGNVAAAGCSSCASGIIADAVAYCGWQLTLDVLDALRSMGSIPVQTVQSESAASLHKVCRSLVLYKLFLSISMGYVYGDVEITNTT